MMCFKRVVSASDCPNASDSSTTSELSSSRCCRSTVTPNLMQTYKYHLDLLTAEMQIFLSGLMSWLKGPQLQDALSRPKRSFEQVSAAPSQRLLILLICSLCHASNGDMQTHDRYMC